MEPSTERKLVTENNLPNRKVVAQALATLIAGWFGFLAIKYGFDVPMGLREALVTALAALLTGVVGYLIPPAPGDGTKIKRRQGK